MLRFFTNRKERKKEGKKESSSSSNGRKENGTISGKSFIKTILPGLGLGQTKGSAQWKRLIDTSLAACSEAINNFDIYFPPSPPLPFFCSLKQTIKNLLKKSRRKITHKLVKKQSDGRVRKRVGEVEESGMSYGGRNTQKHPLGTENHRVQAHKLKYRPALRANVSI